MDAYCPLCKYELEDANHLVWSYDILQQVWALLSVKIPLFDESTSNKLCFANMFSAADDQQRRIIVISIWSLWFHRNKIVHEGIKFSMQTVLGFIRGYEQDICRSRMLLYPTLRATVKGIWRPPDPGVIKLNFEASFVKKEKTATTAVLARNDTGEIVGAETYLFADIANAFVAEARACERALIFTSSMCWRRLIVEGDSLTVIKNIQKEGKDKSVIRLITHHIYNLGMCFEAISYLAVPRIANEAAHTLAMEGRKQKVCGSWVHGVPESVRLAALKDRSAWF
ncbi:hypothetical protein Golax_004540 [Gossypium laxum]|uniref:RNase H type-1 domain-containing protein n=1 Tax=Gossypium laxum TaxID=34288 RepID=A0A7J9AZ22_9ROSI|nr:hypothetical protein [Gossypium laxum]